MSQRFVPGIGDVAGDLLGAKLGVAGHHLELLDVNRGEDIISDDAFRNEDRILEVVAVPRHEGTQHVAAERQFTVVSRRSVPEDLALFHPLSGLDQRSLEDARALVGPLELQQRIDVDIERVERFFLVDPDDDPLRVDLVDHTAPAGDDGGNGIPGHHFLHAGPDERRLGADQWHRLTLHVGTHQGAVGIVVLEEGNEGSGDRHQLLGRHVHHVDIGRFRHDEFAIPAA